MKELVESDVRAVDDGARRVYRIVLLFIIAIFGPFLIGYQYLEWFYDSSTHMTWFIATSLGSIENSDWIGNVWFLRTLFSSGSVDPNMIMGFFTIFILPRLLFAVAVSLYDSNRIRMAYVIASAVPVIIVVAWLSLTMITASIILGTPPGILISIMAPDIDSRLFLPTPFLLLLGFILVRSKK